MDNRGLVYSFARWIRGLVLAIVSVAGVVEGAPAQSSGSVPETLPDSLIVRFKSTDAAGRARSRVHSPRRGTRMHSFRMIPADVVKVARGRSREEVAAAYAADPDVEYVEPNHILRVAAVPNDSKFTKQWALQNTGQSNGTPGADIDAVAAWDTETGDDQVVVAVIDTGIDYNHPDLRDNMWTNELERTGIEFVDDDGNGIVDDIYGARFLNDFGEPTSGDPRDDHFHGTHVAGIIGASANNGIGVAGINHSVRLMAAKFLTSGGFGSTADAISALEYTVLMGAQLTNNSWGGYGFNRALRDAIQAAGEAGQLFVAAAGNDNNNNDIVPFFPASYTPANVIAVASTTRNDGKSEFSSFGVTAVDIAAPGSDILSTGLGSSYITLSGTSMASPHVAGVAALVFARVPGATAAEVKQFILDGADHLPVLDGVVGGGRRLNANGALTAANPNTGRVSFGRVTYACGNTISMRLHDVDLANAGTVNVELDSTTGDDEIVQLSETETPSVFEGTMPTRSDGVVAPDGQLAVLDGQTMTATYQDADDGTGSPATSVATATLDCVPPQLTNVQVSEVHGLSAIIEFDTSELAAGQVRFGSSCSQLTELDRDSGETLAHEIDLEGLTSETTYFFVADAIDPAGTITTDDNGGACYQFTTLFQPDYFTDVVPEPVYTADSKSGQTFTFTPDGSQNFYALCREPATAFPTDPTGSLPQPQIGVFPDLTLEVPLQNSKQVWLYGQAYDRFYISKNGTITFTAADPDELDLAHHFALPRVSGLGHSNPNRGWYSSKQLSDRAVVNFQHFRQYGDHQENDTQVELFFDGRIRITTLSVNSERGALVGLSAGGGLPADFIPTDLGKAARCGEPIPPALPLSGRKFKFKYAKRDWPDHQLLLKIDDPTFDLPAPGSAADPTVNGASLVLFNPTTKERDTYYLPPVYWRARGAGYVYEFIDGRGNSPVMGRYLAGPCESVELEEDGVKVRCQGITHYGMYFDLDESGGQGSLAVMLTLGAGPTAERYCAVFGGDIKRDTVWQGSKTAQFKASKAPAPAQCPPLP